MSRPLSTEADLEREHALSHHRPTLVDYMRVAAYLGLGDPDVMDAGEQARIAAEVTRRGFASVEAVADMIALDKTPQENPMTDPTDNSVFSDLATDANLTVQKFAQEHGYTPDEGTLDTLGWTVALVLAGRTPATYPPTPTGRDEAATLIAEYDAWAKDRKGISAAESNGDYPTSSAWQDSDDRGADLADRLADALRAIADLPRPTPPTPTGWEDEEWQTYTRAIDAARNRRITLGWTVAEVAENAGLTIGAVYSLETHDPDVHLSALQAYARALGAEVSIAVDEAGQESTP